MQKMEESKLSNVVQENIELKKQNSDLKSVIDELVHIRNLHMSIIEKCKQTMDANATLKSQMEAQDNMIKDLVGQIQQQKKEGAELIAQNLKLTDQILNAQMELQEFKVQNETIPNDDECVTPQQKGASELDLELNFPEEDDNNSDYKEYQSLPNLG
jgi:DNA repair exonuclease SbcCD ATPase subunit